MNTHLTPTAASLVAAFVLPLFYSASVAAQATDSAATLPAVTVTAGTDSSAGLPEPHAGGQVARGGRLGMLGNVDLMDAPFNITSYTSQTIANQQAATVADVIGADPSVRITSQSGGLFDSFYIRGFPIAEGNIGEIAFDGTFGVAPNYRVFTDYIERIEVLKGPTALLYGMSPNSGVGGMVNIVPKRAAATDITRVNVSYASDSQAGAGVDLSRRFGPDRRFGIRINGGHQSGDTPLDKQERKARVGAIALDYQGEQMRASLDYFRQNEQIDAPTRPFTLAAGIKVPDAINGKTNVAQAWEWSDVTDQGLLLKGEYQVNSNVSFFASAGKGKTEVSRLFGTPNILNAAGDISYVPGYFKFDIDRSSTDLGVRSKFQTGGIGHAITMQASRYEDQINRGSVNGVAVVSNLFSPVARPEQLVSEPSSVPKLSTTELNGIALSDTLSMLDNRLLVMLGVRHQEVKSDNFNTVTGMRTSTYDRSAVTPSAGIVFKPSDNISVYANYIQGLSKGDIAPATATNAGETFAPYKARQYELGMKYGAGSLTGTVSAFQIKKPSGQLTSNVYAVDGEQSNRGLEFNVFGEVTSSLRLLGGLTLIDAELTETNNPATRGNKPVGVPSVMANLGTEWDMGSVHGLTLNGSVNYTGKQYVNQANTQSLPSWITANVGARYQLKLSGKTTTFRADLKNVFDKDYWSGAASWGAISQGLPRTLLLTASMDF